MSLPPGFLDELRTRTSLAQVVGRKVMWDTRKSNQAKGDLWAPCPFHQEKTASFHVEDRKGFYYCFGCHAKGDAISFVRETENVDFMEAVEILAREAGMQMPARDPQARAKADRRSLLADVMEQAVQYFRLQLATGAAGPARDYLARRGLSPEAQTRWEIGYAPDARQGLFQQLTAKGVPADLVIGAGLAAEPDNSTPFDRFRGRIIFPIRDARGRAIALGGRAMDPNARAKYLNSPETELFDKGRSLYNHGPAREAAGKGQPLIVAEGYMDVIALAEAGFTASVAPLGTAITEDQLQLLWRISPEPIIALDGDKAGLRAAMRVIDLALPLLEPGRSLRFCLMPQGKDPDDLIKQDGADAMRQRLEASIPMVDLLWRRETEGKLFDSPERKAALDKALGEATGKIQDQGLRRHYDDALKQMRWELFRPAPKKRGRTPGRFDPAKPQTSTKSSLLATEANEATETHLREAVILATLITHPGLIDQFVADLETLPFTDPDHRAVLGAVLASVGDPEGPEAKIAALVGPNALENLLASRHVRIAPGARKDADRDVAALCVTDAIGKLKSGRGLAMEIDEAMEDLAGAEDEGLTWRLAQAAAAKSGGPLGLREDEAEYDVAPTGAKMKRDERNALDALLGTINFERSGRRGG